MNFQEMMMWTEALASCAIEGNQTAARILALRATNPVAFYQEIDRLKKLSEEDSGAETTVER